MIVPGLIAVLLLLSGPVHAEANLKIYPRLSAAQSEDRVLIVAPHVDDETIAASGYAADAIANGAEVYVVFLTAGDCNRFSARILNKTLEPTASNYLSVGRTRIGEAHAAMRLLGVPASHYFILGYPDRGLRSILADRTSVVRARGTRESAVPYSEAMTPGSPYSFQGLMSDVERVFRIARPTVVIAPVGFDLHPDHSAAAEITDLGLSDLGLHPQRLGYLVHASRVPMSLLRMPDRALEPPARLRGMDWVMYPLTRALQMKKDALLQSYRSQGPYTAILRNAFIRTNELFFVYKEQPVASAIPAMFGSENARIPISR